MKRFISARQVSMRSQSLPQNSRYVALSVKHSEDLKRLVTELIDDQVGENSVEQYWPIREIRPAVTPRRHVGQPVKTFENLCDDPVRSFQIRPFSRIKPDGIDIENRIFGQQKRVQ